MSSPKIDMSFGNFGNKHLEKHIGKILWNRIVGNAMSTLTHNSLPPMSLERKQYLASLAAFGGHYIICHKCNKDADAFEKIDIKQSAQELRKRFKRISEKKE